MVKNKENGKAAYKAANLCSEKIYRPLVYVCSPYRGDVKRNIDKARKYSRFAIENTVIPITPHLLYPQFMDDSNPYERYFAIHTINYVLIGKCQELWVFGDEITDGMAREIELAKKRRKTIKYFTEDLQEVKNETNHI